jgi:hypothetical protein
VDKDGMVVGSDGGRKKTRVLSMGEGGDSLRKPWIFKFSMIDC